MDNKEFLYFRFRTKNYYELACVGLNDLKTWISAEFDEGLVYKSKAWTGENPLEIEGLKVYRLTQKGIDLRDEVIQEREKIYQKWKKNNPGCENYEEFFSDV